MNKSVLAVFAIILVAGCVGQTTTPTPSSGTGLAITEFDLQPTDVRSATTMNVYMTLENQGQNSVAKGDWMGYLIYPTGGTAGWTLNSPGTPYQTKSLELASASGSRPAGTTRLTWQLTAPTLDRGQAVPYTFTGRAYYTYNTEGKVTIPVYPFGESVTDQTVATFDKGPVEITAEVSPNPPIVEADGESFTLKLTLKNVGEGTVFLPDAVIYPDNNNPVAINIDDNKRDRVNLHITLPQGPDLSTTGAACDTSDVLFFDKTAQVFCDITVAKKPSTKQPFVISVSADYGYFVEKSATVTVMGR